MSEELRFRLEQHAVAVCLSVSAVLFILGRLIQLGDREVSRALTWGTK